MSGINRIVTATQRPHVAGNAALPTVSVTYLEMFSLDFYVTEFFRDIPH
jgi:hypothetical protein